MKKIHKIFFFVWVMISISSSEIFAQLPPEVSAQLSKLTPMPALKSPNMASQEKYGDYSVNLFTGLPEISIPIYEVSSGPLSIPITLSYHASGFKYTDQSSWVGLGWTVQAGGQISRSFQGKPDEETFLNLTNNYSVPGGGDCNNWSYKEGALLYNNDHEPDLFNYSFPGSSGKFYLQQGTASPYLFPFQPLRIQRYNTLGHFDITNEKGIVHRFGANWSGIAPAKESLFSQSGGGTTSGVVAWYLQELRSPNTDDYITLTYQTVGTLQNSDFEYNLSVIDQCNTNNPTGLPCPSAVGVQQQVMTSSSTTQIGVDEIIFKTGKVKFFMTTANRTDVTSAQGMKSLDRIEVYRKDGINFILIKSFHFKTSYFRNFNNTGDAHLKLDHLEIRDGAGTLINKYSFSYHTNTIQWARPNSMNARDYFGFYNGKLSNTTLIPSTTISYQPNTQTMPSNIVIGSADRSTDTTFLKNAVLKRITFPTKGYTEFDYEPHQYSEGGVTTYVPGLRVKRISTFDGQRTISKNYRYGTGESGLGHKNFDLRGFYFFSEQLIRSSCATVPCDREYRSRMFFSNSVIGPGYEDAPVVYTTVAEYQNGGSTNGRIDYEFDGNSLIADPLFTVPHSNKTFRNSMSWARGKLTKKTVFNSSGSQVAQTSVSYTNLASQTSNIGQAGTRRIIGRWNGFRFSPCSGHPQGFDVDGQELIMWNFQKTTGNFKETSRTEVLNYGTASTSTTTIKSFNSTYLLPVFEETLNSSNPEVIRTTYRYPFDVVNIATVYTGLPNILKQMLLKNMFAYPIEQFTWVKPTASSTQEVVGGQVIEFDEIIGTGYYQPKWTYFLEPSSLGSAYTQVGLSGTTGLTRDSRYALRLTVDLHDTRGNVLQYTLKDGQTKSFLYAHDGVYTIAEATNSPGSSMSYTSFETSEKGGWTYSGLESRVIAGEAKTGNNVYLLNNGNITKLYRGSYKLSLWVRQNSAGSSLTINGVNYTADVGPTWKLIEVTGTGGTITISGSNTIVDELRVHSINGMLTTYTVQPLLGITSQFDSRNQGTFYYYDQFGRLETVRDHDGNILNHYEYIF